MKDADLAVLPSGAWPGSVRSVDTASTALVNLGLRVLRSLFETWVSSGGAGLRTAPIACQRVACLVVSQSVEK
eukprot:4656448-Amphidinium_carterae.1